MMSATFLFCIWLIPAPADYKSLSQEILNLAEQFGFHYFEPHTTLFCGETENLTTLKENCKTLFQDTPKITVKTNGTQVQDEAQHNFFIRLQRTPQLNALYNRVKILDKNSQYSFDPHLSLSYGVPTEKINSFSASYMEPKIISFNGISLRPLKQGSKDIETIDTIDKIEVSPQEIDNLKNY